MALLGIQVYCQISRVVKLRPAARGSWHNEAERVMPTVNICLQHTSWARNELKTPALEKIAASVRSRTELREKAKETPELREEWIESHNGTAACFIARTGAAASTHTGRGITPAAGRGITPAAVGARPKATEHNLIDSSDEDEEREALLKPGTNSGTNSGRGITPASM